MNTTSKIRTISFHRKLSSLQEALTEATNQSQRIQELLDRANEDHKSELSSLNAQHEKTISQHAAEKEELVSCYRNEFYLMFFIILLAVETK